MSDGAWRVVFLTAAIFNWIVGVTQMFDTTGFAAAMGLQVVAYHAFYSPLVGWFIVLFGMFYFAVSRDLSNRTMVLIGTIGKLGVVAFVLYAAAQGIAPMGMVGLVAVDAIYTVLFTLFLMRPATAGARS
jgi:hypothetical protein